MFWSSSKESVTIYSGKTSKKLCKIEAPQKWYYPKGLIYYGKVWKDPEAITRWAWTQARIIYTQKDILAKQVLQAKGRFLFKLKDIFCYPCVICGQKTVVSVRTVRFFFIRGGEVGYACSNKDCPMKMVMIPKILIERITEMPMEYLPANWVKPTKAESGSEKSET